jgi:hypothetical protein
MVWSGESPPASFQLQMHAPWAESVPKQTAAINMHQQQAKVPKKWLGKLLNVITEGKRCFGAANAPVRVWVRNFLHSSKVQLIPAKKEREVSAYQHTKICKC